MFKAFFMAVRRQIQYASFVMGLVFLFASCAFRCWALVNTTMKQDQCSSSFGGVVGVFFGRVSAPIANLAQNSWMKVIHTVGTLCCQSRLSRYLAIILVHMSTSGPFMQVSVSLVLLMGDSFLPVVQMNLSISWRVDSALLSSPLNVGGR